MTKTFLVFVILTKVRISLFFLKGKGDPSFRWDDVLN